MPQADITIVDLSEGVSKPRRNKKIATVCCIHTGEYTGDGTTGQGITGIGFQPIYLRIWKKLTSDAADATMIETSDTIIDDHASKMSILIQDTGAAENISGQIDRITSLDTDGFTVSDDGGDLSPNKNTQAYNYLCLG